jgi:hypothetical protein
MRHRFTKFSSLRVYSIKFPSRLLFSLGSGLSLALLHTTQNFLPCFYIFFYFQRSFDRLSTSRYQAELCLTVEIRHSPTFLGNPQSLTDSPPLSFNLRGKLFLACT